MSSGAAWLTLAGLGAYHGLNPAMGWLFAVSQGLQSGERRAVVRSFLPIAAGHEAAVVVVAVLVLGLGAVTDPAVLHVGAAVVLIAFGFFRFARPRAHPRWTTMRVTRGELTWWSFLMSSAHGAGLMVAPVLLGGATASASEGHDLATAASAPAGVAAALVLGGFVAAGCGGADGGGTSSAITPATAPKQHPGRPARADPAGAAHGRVGLRGHDRLRARGAARQGRQDGACAQEGRRRA